jgi:hypothetical protein
VFTTICAAEEIAGTKARSTKTPSATVINFR